MKITAARVGTGVPPVQAERSSAVLFDAQFRKRTAVAKAIKLVAGLVQGQALLHPKPRTVFRDPNTL